MLVFQGDFDHIVERCEYRAQIDPSWLIKIVAEINLYLPDDWRLTRSGHGFSIQIIADNKNVVLKGVSFRTGGNKVLSILNTVFLPSFPDLRDLKSAGTKLGEVVAKDKKGQYIKDSNNSVKINVSASIKKDNPDSTRPNLYFFRPCPDNLSSPLFARQYEKVKKDKKGGNIGDEYHRIHPLIKAGLDLEHFRWIKRNIINGHVEFVDKVDHEYHGNDYWILKVIDKNSSNNFLENYISILKKYEITPPGMPQSTQTYEIEYKFMLPDDGKEAVNNFDLIKSFAINENNLSIAHEGRPKELVDSYFDDENKTLHNSGISFRMREGKDNLRVALKKRFPVDNAGDSEKGIYNRIEEEAVITNGQEKELLAGRPINVLPYRLIQYVAPRCETIKPILKVTNKRKVLVIEDSSHRKAEICFDIVRYTIDGKDHGPYHELELESKGMPRESLKGLVDYIINELNLNVSGQSKYERGISIHEAS